METVHNRINLINIPYTDRGSRLLLFRQENELALRLAERWAKWENEVGHYRKRPPLIQHLKFLTEAGEPLNFETDTYPYVVQLKTSIGSFDWTFIDPEAVLIRLPEGRFRIEFIVYSQQGHTDYRGGVFKGKRNIAYTTNAKRLENTVEALDTDHFQVKLLVDAKVRDSLLLNITPRLGYNRSIPDADKGVKKVQTEWQAWYDAAPPVLDEYRAQYEYAWWVMRSGLVNTRFYFTREALLPSKIHYVGVWHWDQVFHALAYRHVDMHLAEDQLRIVLDHQRDDGMLPDAIHDEGTITHLKLPVDADVTKPPIMTWGVLKLYEISQEPDFLQEVYEPLARWNQWWMTSNRNENGLCEYHHPFSSGLDDSPLWDYGMPVVAPDLNTYIVLQHENLARIARLIGEDAAAENHERQANEIVEKMIALMWDEESGLFRALHDGNPIPTVTPFSLMPLITGRLPEHINQRLIANLTDPKLFWTTHPIPTVAISDPSFDPNQMWRGPVWVNINYLFVEGLKRIGQHELAGELRRKTLDLMMMHNDIYEYYHPFTGDHPPKAAPIFGWSSATFIELAIDETAARKEAQKITQG